MAHATLVFNKISSNHDVVLNFHYEILLLIKITHLKFHILERKKYLFSVNHIAYTNVFYNALSNKNESHVMLHTQILNF
jgi:hypothetical protein